MFHSVTDVLPGNAHLGSLAEELVRAALLANTPAGQAHLGELGRSRTGGTLLGHTVHPASSQAETLGAVRVLIDLALVYSEGRSSL